MFRSTSCSKASIARSPGRRRQINSLAYCVKAIEEVIEEQKDTHVERPELAADFQRRNAESTWKISRKRPRQ